MLLLLDAALIKHALSSLGETSVASSNFAEITEFGPLHVIEDSDLFTFEVLPPGVELNKLLFEVRVLG